MSRVVPLATLLLAVGCPAPTPTDTDSKIVVDDSAADDSGTPVPENHAPSTPLVAITPEHPSAGEALSLSFLALAEDPDGDAITYRYEWSRGATVEPSLTTDTVPAGTVLDGETWSVRVTPSDGIADGAPATASVTIGNLAPSAPVIRISPHTPGAGDTLTLVEDTPAVDPEGDPLTQTITWYVDGAHAVSWDGATSVAGAQVDSGEVYRVVVSVTDGAHDPVVAEDTVTVSNAAPSIDAITLNPATPEDDDDLSVRVRASDPDGDSLSTSYRWYRDGVEAVDVGDADTVDAARTAEGEAWYVTVTVSDGAASVSEDSDTVTIVGPTSIRYGQYLEAVATGGASDGTWDTMSGSWEVLLQTEGAMYGHVDCDAWYDLTSTGTPRCPGCTYAFDLDITYDASASTMNTPTVCAYMEVDGTGSVSMDRFGEFSFSAYGPGIGVYYYGVPYSFGGYMYWYVYGNYTYGYPGYYRSMGAATAEDTAGNLEISAWSYVYMTY